MTLSHLIYIPALGLACAICFGCLAWSMASDSNQLRIGLIGYGVLFAAMAIPFFIVIS